MKFYVFSNNELVGWTELKLTDKSMGCASGVFHAEIAYQKIRSVIQEFFHLPQGLLLDPHSNEKWNQYRAKVDALNLKILDGDGIALDPVGGFNIQDLPDEYIQDMQSEDVIVEIVVLGLHWQEKEKYFGES
jgi:hypothetical protein